MRISGKRHWPILLLCLPAEMLAVTLPAPDSWIPARWTGGPLELARRAKANKLPADPAARDALANWYDTATLSLLDGSPVNCLLVTWSAGADGDLERRQQQLVKAYAAAAHQRGVAVLGLVDPGSALPALVAAAAGARLDGLVLEGEFPQGFADRAAGTVVIPIFKDAASARGSRAPVLAVKGVSPSARNLADMGIRGAPSSEPWIQSNVWLVRTLRPTPASRPVWISYQPDGGTPADYARSVADAAVAGGRWIVATDDSLRAGLRRRDAAALAGWQRIADCLRFARDYAGWRGFAPYGNLGIVLDIASANPDMADEYLKLVARRQVPYRLIARSDLSAAALAGFRAVLATELAPPTAGERKLLRAFAENGGLVVAGPSWGNPPKDQPFAEVPLGKGRVVVYQDPDPESVARDLRDLLSRDQAGVVAFNVPSVITYAARGGGGRLLVQLLNYSNSPATAITIRAAGNFKTARWFTLDGAPADLAISAAEGRTDVTIPELSLWGGVLLEPDKEKSDEKR